MATGTRAIATIDDLHRVDGKAELIAGRIVHFMAASFRPNRVAFRIARSLGDHAEATGQGLGTGDNLGYAVPILSSGRQSFSADASYYVAPLPSDSMRFIEGPPTLAVEVRGEDDCGAAAEAEMVSKRADYFEAGTLAVRDVDPLARIVASYQAGTPDLPIVFSVGQDADAGPAVPGWRLAVDRIFRV